ncbi:MAG: hypothetical protein R3Y61_02040 [Rikenellaceae bacterium]
MRKFLLFFVLLFSAVEAYSQMGIFRQDSLSDKAQQIWQTGQTNIFDDPRAPRFVMASKDQNYLFGIGGYVEAKGFYDFTGVGSDGLYLYDLAVPYSSSAPNKMGFGAAGSKLIFKMLGNTKFGVLEATFETGFQSDSYTMYLSRAYIRFGNFLVGQDWSVTADTYSFPTVLDGADPVAKFGYKVPQIRYSFNATKSLELNFSLEFPTLTYNYNGDEYYIADLMPDLDAKLVYKSPSGVYVGQVAGMFRVMEADLSGLVDTTASSKVGYALTTSHQLKLAGGLHTLYLGGSVGVGVSECFGGISGHNINLLATVSSSGQVVSLVPTSIWGVVGGYRLQINSFSECNFVASYLNICDWMVSSGSSFYRTDIPEHLFGASANYLATIEKDMVLGAEIVYGTKVLYNDTANSGMGLRLNLLMRYNF